MFLSTQNQSELVSLRYRNRTCFLFVCVVSPSAGDCWFHIPSPAKQKLKQVSVGRTSVHAVDENSELHKNLVYKRPFLFFCRLLLIMSDVVISCPGNLWYRQGVTPSYPQGSSWEHISNNVRKVSVGPLDQVGTRTSVLHRETSLTVDALYCRH